VILRTPTVGSGAARLEPTYMVWLAELDGPPFASFASFAVPLFLALPERPQSALISPSLP
jgi:hypothetical protein